MWIISLHDRPSQGQVPILLLLLRWPNTDLCELGSIYLIATQRFQEIYMVPVPVKKVSLFNCSFMLSIFIQRKSMRDREVCQKRL